MKKKRTLVSLGVEIVIMIGVIIGSFPLWKKFDSNNYSTIAASYANMAFVDYYVDQNFSNLLLKKMNNEEALVQEQFELLIKNFKMGKVNYKLAFKITKDSTLHYNTLKAVVNNEIYRLRDLDVIEDDEYYYVIFDQGVLEETVKEYSFYLFIQESIILTPNNSINISVVLI